MACSDQSARAVQAISLRLPPLYVLRECPHIRVLIETFEAIGGGCKYTTTIITCTWWASGLRLSCQLI